MCSSVDGIVQAVLAKSEMVDAMRKLLYAIRRQSRATTTLSPPPLAPIQHHVAPHAGSASRVLFCQLLM